MEWVVNATPRFTPRKETWYPLYRRLDGPEGRSGRVRKILLHPTPGFDPRTVQPVASRCNDCTILAHNNNNNNNNNNIEPG